MEQEKPKTRSKIIMYFALLMMLVVLPGMSWFYLSLGFNDYKDRMATLGKYGSLKQELQINIDKDEDQKVYIVGIGYDSYEQLDMMNYVFEPFKDSDKVGLITTSSILIDTIPQIIDQFKLEKGIKSNWESRILRNQEVEPLISFPDRADFIKKPLNEYLLLVDTDGVIRNYYYLGDTLSMNELIVTTSVIMPRGQKEDMIYEPETEL